MGVTVHQLMPLRDAWLFYIVFDVSASMWRREFHPGAVMTPHDVMSNSLPALLEELEEHKTAGDLTYLTVATFADDVNVVMPATWLGDGPVIGALPCGVETNYEAVFRWLRYAIDADITRLRSQGFALKVPAVFFVTDGEPQRHGQPQPEELWGPARLSLDSLPSERRPLIVSLGLGQVRDETLTKVASTSPRGAACVAEPGVAASELLHAIIDIIIFSVTHSTRDGSFVFDTPRGMRRLS